MIRKPVIAALAVTLLLVAGCSMPSITGTVVDKYIEDFTEHTVVVKEADGDVHHFTIDADDWRSLRPGQPFNSDNYGQPIDD